VERAQRLLAERKAKREAEESEVKQQNSSVEVLNKG